MTLSILIGGALFCGIKSSVPADPAEPLAATPPPAVADTLPPPDPLAGLKPFEQREQVTVLLAVTGAAGERTASLMLLVINLSKVEQVGLINIPPHTLVDLDEHGERTVDQAYALGGRRLAAKAIARATGHDIDYWLGLSCRELAALVTVQGGLRVRIEEELEYTSPSGQQYQLHPGLRLLDGDEAVAYLLAGKSDQPTHGHIRRQQRLLRELVRTLAATSQDRSPVEVANALRSIIETTLDQNQMIKLVQILQAMDPDRVVAVQLPGNEEAAGESRVYRLVPEAAAVVPDVARSLRSRPREPLVTVYNGSGRIGLEVSVVAKLTEAGLKAVSAGSAPVAETPRTRIYTVDDNGAAAKVAAVLGLAAEPAAAPPDFPPAQAQQTRSLSRVVLVIGADFLEL